MDGLLSRQPVEADGSAQRALESTSRGGTSGGRSTRSWSASLNGATRDYRVRRSQKPPAVAGGLTTQTGHGGLSGYVSFNSDDCSTSNGSRSDTQMRTSHLQIKRATLVFLLCLVAALFAPGRLGAHEPITTKILFNKEVVRVLQRNCLGCHRPGGIAPMSLATYEEARPWAKAIKEELLEKRMPPCGVVRGFGDFRNSFPITQREIDLIVNWVEGGAPAGKPDLLPQSKLYTDDWALGKPDLVLKPKTSQNVNPDADEYREIVLPVKRKSPISINAIDLRPERRSVVHCATFYVASLGDKKPTSGGPPVTDRRRRVLGTWVPGQPPFQLPEGASFVLPASSEIIARIHYRGSGEATKDRSEIGLYLSNSAGRQVAELDWLNGHTSVDGTGEMRATASISEDMEGLGVLPLVRKPLSLQVTAYRRDGSVEILVWTKGTQFDWQPTLVFKNPVSLPKGTIVEVLARTSNVVEVPPPVAGSAEGNSRNPDPLCVVFVAPAGGTAKVEPTQADK